jgi:ribosomal protein S18 acetylase RimI-like enzyme
MTLTLRPATPADVPVIVAFNEALAFESENTRLDSEVLAAGVRAMFDDPTRGFYTLAERNGEIVGQIMVTYEWSDWRNGWFWWIQSVYVRDDARRGGVFRALYREIERRATADPTVIGLRLYFDRDNTKAQATYIALGMVQKSYDMMERYPLDGRKSDVA